MFCLTEVKGKGLGFVALKKIKLGTLILREEPCLLLHPEFSELGMVLLVQTKFNTKLSCFENKREMVLNRTLGEV